MKKKLPTIQQVIAHARDRNYESMINRSKERTKQNGEIFTPTPLVQEMLDQLPKEEFTNPTKTFMDPSCGDGQFLSEVLIRKMENGSSLEQALSTIYGVELMKDNADLCRERLLCGQEHLRRIVEVNIFQADFLQFSPFLETAETWEEAILAYSKHYEVQVPTPLAAKDDTNAHQQGVTSMPNLFELLEKQIPTLSAAVESNIKPAVKPSKTPEEAARDKFLSKIDQNIEGIKALNEGKEWPTTEYTKSGVKKYRRHACWFKENKTDETYEIYLKHGYKPIYGLLGFDKKSGAANTVISGVKKNQLLTVFSTLRTIIDSGQVDKFLMDAVEKARAQTIKNFGQGKKAA